MKYLNPNGYEEFYDTKKCHRENQYIKNLLYDFKGEVLDIGCGNGLGFTLLDRTDGYFGVDIDRNRITFAQRNYGDGNFGCYEAYSFLKKVGKVENIISLFSINYMNPKIIDLIVKKCNNFIIIHYNRPWKEGSNSIYANEKEYFIKELYKRHQEIMQKLEEVGAETYNLLGEPYYYVSIYTKNE